MNIKGDNLVQENYVNEYGDGVTWTRGPMLGKGYSGRVYLATLKNPKSKNILLPPLIAVKSAEVSNSATLRNEVDIMRNLSECPHVVTCFGDEITMGQNGVMAYNLLLEYGSGGTLSDRIVKSDGHGLPELEARLHTRSILRGLSHIHRLGYVHCDVTSDNVLLVPNYSRKKGIVEFRAKICDFGYAKKMEYVHDAACDILNVGCVVVEMLTGKLPLYGGKDEVLRRLSRDARQFVMCCFERKFVGRLRAENFLGHPFVVGLDDDE